MSTKNVTASSFSTFISVLREEQRNGYSLQKFDYKNGYFCGGLSSDNLIPGSYHEALAAIDEESKDIVLLKIISLLPQDSKDKLDDGSLMEQQIEQIKQLSPVSDLPKSRITRSLEDVIEETLKQEQKDGDSAASVGENESSPNGQKGLAPIPSPQEPSVKRQSNRVRKKPTPK